MNMDINITQYINLDSYSSTPGFLGYTDNAPDFSETGIDALCDDFLKKMAEYINDVTVVSSLFISSNKEELSLDYDAALPDIDKFLFILQKYDIIKSVDFEKLARQYPPETAEFDREFRKLETAFTFQLLPDAEILKEILSAFFHAIGLNGHLFLVFKTAELIVYPHSDDLGFGFINMNQGRFNEQKEFLKSAFGRLNSIYWCGCADVSG